MQPKLRRHSDCRTPPASIPDRRVEPREPRVRAPRRRPPLLSPVADALGALRPGTDSGDSNRVARNLWSNLDILPLASVGHRRWRRTPRGGGPALVSRNEIGLRGKTVVRPDMVGARGKKPYYKTQLDGRKGASIIVVGDWYQGAGTIAGQLEVDPTCHDERLVLIFGGRSRGESR